MSRTQRLLEDEQTPEGAPEQTPGPLSFDAVSVIREALVPGSVWEIVIIREGWSRNNTYYGKDVLRRAAPLFEGAAVQYYPDQKHLRPTARRGGEGPADANAGVLSKVREHECSGRLELRADFHATHPILQEQLRRYGSLDGIPCPLGFSIDGQGCTVTGLAEGRSGTIVQDISEAYELTIVARPSAGGKFVRLVAGDSTEEEDEMSLLNWLKNRRAAKKRSTAGLEALPQVELLREACADLREDLGDAAVLGLALEWLGQGKTEEVAALLNKMIEQSSASAPVMEATVTKRDALATGAAGTSALGEADRILESIRLKERGLELSTRLASAKLPPQGEAIIRKQFEGKVFADADLQEAIVSLKEALSSVIPAGGAAQAPSAAPNVHMGVGPVERHKAAWDLIMEYDFTKDPACDQELYKHLQKGGNRYLRPARLYEEWFDSIDSQHVGPRAILHEAVSANYPTILGDAMSRRMVQIYNTIPDRSDELVTVVPDISNFKTQSRIALGGWGDLPTVAESTSADYPTLERPDEHYSEYSLTKRGGLFAITWEMMLNDDMRVFRNIPKRLAQAARMKKMKFTYGLVIGGSTLGGWNADTTYDSVVLFHASHSNTSTSALAQASLFAARQAIKNQKQFSRAITLNAAYTSGGTSLTYASTAGFGKGDFIQIESEIFRVTAVTNSTTLAVVGAQCGTIAANHADQVTTTLLTEPVAVDTFHVLVPTELEGTLDVILNSQWLPGGANNDNNVLYGDSKANRMRSHAVNSVFLQGDVTNWALIADKSQIETYELGYLNGQVDPEIFVQESPTEGNMFMRDAVTYKIRQVYGGKAVDWRGAYGAIVSG